MCSSRSNRIAGSSGQHDAGNSGGHQQIESGTRGVGQQQLAQLVTHPFGADDRDALGHLGHGLPGRLVRPRNRAGSETRGAHHAQRIVAEADLGGARGAQRALGQIGQASVGIHETPIAQVAAAHIEGHRVHGEIAAHQVVLDAQPIDHLGLAGTAAVRIRAEGGDLDQPFVVAAPGQCADGAEVAADIPHGVAIVEQSLGLIGPR